MAQEGVAERRCYGLATLPPPHTLHVLNLPLLLRRGGGGGGIGKKGVRMSLGKGSFNWQEIKLISPKLSALPVMLNSK